MVKICTDILLYKYCSSIQQFYVNGKIISEEDRVQNENSNGEKFVLYSYENDDETFYKKIWILIENDYC